MNATQSNPLVGVYHASPEPVDLFGPDVTAEPAQKHEWKAGDHVRIVKKAEYDMEEFVGKRALFRQLTGCGFCVVAIDGRPYVIPESAIQPEPIREPVIDRRASLIADLRTGGIDAVRKRLPDILAELGITREDRDAIIAQVDKGEKQTRETAKCGSRLAGIGRWVGRSKDRRANVSLRSGQVEVWLTVFPDITAKHATFIGHSTPPQVVMALDAIMADPRNDAVVEAGEVFYGLGSRGLARLAADLESIDAAD